MSEEQNTGGHTVPPIYQPEMGARAVLHAALQPRRTTSVGLPTAGIILTNRVIAPVLDRYLARTGYCGQQTGKDRRPEIGDNLYHPVAGDHGAHGDFDERSHRHSAELWVSPHRRALFAGLGGLLGVAPAPARSR